MKRRLMIGALFSLTVFMSCGGPDSGTNKSQDSSDSTANDTESKEAEFGDIPDLLSQSSYSTDEFIRLTDFLNEKEVTLTGYPYAYPLGIGEAVEFTPGRTDMLDGVDNSKNKCAVRLQFENEEEVRTMKIGDLFAVKGKLDISYSVSEQWGNTTSITLKEAHFVDDVEDVAGSISSIEDIDTKKQIFCGDLFSVMDEHYQGIVDKGTIAVTGAYIMTTTSSSLEGEVLEIRVDLGPATSEKVGCEMVETPDDEALSAKRTAGEKVTIEGTFSGINWEPRIGNCVIK